MTTRAGYEAWLLSFGAVERVGVEGTSSDGSGLARFLMDQEIEVIEVDRPPTKRFANTSAPPRTPLSHS